MSIIRIETDEVFTTDSLEYDILVNAVPKVKDIEGAIVEIGTRRGGSAKMIMDAFVENEDTNRSFFCIDPYGNIELECTNLNLNRAYAEANIELEGDRDSKAISRPVRLDYTNDMRNSVIPALYQYAYSKGFNFNFFCLEDTEFFQRYADGVPTYDTIKRYNNRYAFVFFDGPHTNKAVLEETEFFIRRSTKGSVFVYDDIWMYDHHLVERRLFSNGFEVLEKKDIKASYVKTL